MTFHLLNLFCILHTFAGICAFNHKSIYVCTSVASITPLPGHHMAGRTLSLYARAYTPDLVSLSLQHWNISQTKIRVISTLLFVLFGCLLFVALPAAIFKHIEGWSALESLYFVVITLTTIGFGDFVAGD